VVVTEVVQIKGPKLMRVCEAVEEPNATTKVRRKVVSKHHSFLSVDRRLLETAAFRGRLWDVDRLRSVCNVRVEKQILEVAER
jgi:hypothetical protein